MAITYIVGNPGSGKSYLAVYKIYEHFYVNKKKKPKNDAANLEKYDFCYTNINEFKFDKFDNVLEFDLNDIRFHLVNLFNMYKGKSPDSVFCSYCKHRIFRQAKLGLQRALYLKFPYSQKSISDFPRYPHS